MEFQTRFCITNTHSFTKYTYFISKFIRFLKTISNSLNITINKCLLQLANNQTRHFHGMSHYCSIWWHCLNSIIIIIINSTWRDDSYESEYKSSWWEEHSRVLNRSPSDHHHSQPASDPTDRLQDTNTLPTWRQQTANMMPTEHLHDTNSETTDITSWVSE